MLAIALCGQGDDLDKREFFLFRRATVQIDCCVDVRIICTLTRVRIMKRERDFSNR